MLPRWGKSLLLSLHIVLTGAWLGATALVLWLLADARQASDLAAFRIHDVAIWSSLAVLGTSVCFAIFTPWGFFKHRWLLLKWLGLVALSLIAVFVRTPALNALAAAVDVGEDAGGWRAQALGSATIELVALVLLVVLSVFKPWGKTSLSWSPPRVALVPAALALVVVVMGLSIAQSLVLVGYRATEVPPVPVPAGTASFEGSARLGVGARATVRIEGGRIVDVQARAVPDSHYARLAQGVARKMVREQRVDVDAVTGATTTSRALQLAAADALRRCAR